MAAQFQRDGDGARPATPVRPASARRAARAGPPSPWRTRTSGDLLAAESTARGCGCARPPARRCREHSTGQSAIRAMASRTAARPSPETTAREAPARSAHPTRRAQLAPEQQLVEVLDHPLERDHLAQRRAPPRAAAPAASSILPGPRTNERPTSSAERGAARRRRAARRTPPAARRAAVQAQPGGQQHLAAGQQRRPSRRPRRSAPSGPSGASGSPASDLAPAARRTTAGARTSVTAGSSRTELPPEGTTCQEIQRLGSGQRVPSRAGSRSGAA